MTAAEETIAKSWKAKMKHKKEGGTQNNTGDILHMNK